LLPTVQFAFTKTFSTPTEVLVTIPERQETITVKIPAGAWDGTRLRLKGKGRPGKIGESSGDFYILLHVK